MALKIWSLVSISFTILTFYYAEISYASLQSLPMSKQTRTVFATTDRSSSPHASHLLHIDIRGPYRHQTHNGFKYFLTMVDDFPRTTWVFLMHFESDTLQILEQFFAFVSNHFGKSINTFVLIMLMSSSV